MCEKSCKEMEYLNRLHERELKWRIFLKESQVNSDLQKRVKHRISVIQDAIRRLDNGEFGRCLCCHRAISPARLDKTPFVEYCFHCKRAFEIGRANNL